MSDVAGASRREKLYSGGDVRLSVADVGTEEAVLSVPIGRLRVDVITVVMVMMVFLSSLDAEVCVVPNAIFAEVLSDAALLEVV